MARRYDTPPWVEVYADVNLTYGGFWVQDYGDYAETMELIDLDGGAGVPDLLMLESGSVGFYTRSIREAIRRYKSAISSCGWLDGDGRMRGNDRESRRLNVWHAMSEYGYGDREEGVFLCTEYAGLEEVPIEALLTWREWTPLNDVIFVDGEEGLREWLWLNRSLPVNEPKE